MGWTEPGKEKTDTDCTEEEYRDGLRAVYKAVNGREIDLSEVEAFAEEVRKIYCATVGISEDQVKVEVDLFNGIIRIDGVAKSEAHRI